jgi:hypothetical protein
LGRLFFAYFLARSAECSEARLMKKYGRNHWRGNTQPRVVGTLVGKVH